MKKNRKPSEQQQNFLSYWKRFEEVGIIKLPLLFFVKQKAVLFICFAQLFRLLNKKITVLSENSVNTWTLLYLFIWVIYYVLGIFAVLKPHRPRLAYSFLTLSPLMIGFQVLCPIEVSFWYSTGLNLYLVFFAALLILDYLILEEATCGKLYKIVYDFSEIATVLFMFLLFVYSGIVFLFYHLHINLSFLPSKINITK